MVDEMSCSFQEPGALTYTGNLSGREFMYRSMLNSCRGKIISASHSPWAVAWLGAFAFAESLILPLPVELIFVPLVLSASYSRYLLVAVAAAGTAAGAALAYPAGAFLLTQSMPIVERLDYLDELAIAQEYVTTSGPWLLVLGSATPVPLKLLMFAGGMSGSPFFTLLLSCLLGQLLRFAVVALLARAGLRIWGALRQQLQQQLPQQR